MRIRAARADDIGGMFKDAVEVLSMVDRTDLEFVERLLLENRIDYAVTGGQDEHDPIRVFVQRIQANTALILVESLKSA